MKDATHRALGVLLASLALSFGARAAMAQDPVKVAPEQNRVLLENDRVRVYDWTTTPGQKVAMHTHPAFVTYFLSDCTVKYTLRDGKTTKVQFKAGDTRWSEPVTHVVENPGTTDIHAIIVELKPRRQ